VKFQLARANSFKRSFKKAKLTDDEETHYIEVVYNLLNGNPLDARYKDHQLKGNLRELRECHIKPDLLLVYRIENDTLELVDIGSHSELFK